VSLSGPEVPPRSGRPAQQLVVILHGYGADGEDLIGVGEHWASLLPDALFVAPNAPTRCAQNPFGYEWFPLDFEHMAESVRIGAPAVRVVVEGYVQKLWARTGLGAAQTILAGFSQGAMMALLTGVGIEPPLAGIVSFSGAFVPPEHAGKSKAPVCLIHGELDPVVDPRLTTEAAIALRALGHEVGVHVSPGMAHGIAPDGLIRCRTVSY
jgi:phospholipase/carboxylesterase